MFTGARAATSWRRDATASRTMETMRGLDTVKIEARNLSVGDVLPIDVRRRSGTRVTGSCEVIEIVSVTDRSVTIIAEYSGDVVPSGGLERRTNRYSLGTMLDITAAYDDDRAAR